MAVIYSDGQVIVQAGVFLQFVTQRDILVNQISTGIVAALVDTTRGPLGTVTEVTSLGQLEERFGTGAGANVVAQALYGGAQVVKVLRVGTGGTAASRTMVDTTGSPINAATLTAKDVGVDGSSLNVTIVDDPANPTTLRLLKVYRSTTLLETHSFTKGATGTGEPQLMVAAVNANSSVITGANIADGNKILAAVSTVSLTGGAAPTVNGASWTDGFTVLTGEQWNILVMSTDSDANIAALTTQMATWFNAGKFVEAVVGQLVATEATIAGRATKVGTQNSYLVRGVVNGFTQNAATVEGPQAAGRYAGMIAARAVTETTTFAPVSFATAAVNAPSGAALDDVITKGAVAFIQGDDGIVRISKDVTSKTVLAGQEDEGWKHGRNVRQRLNFFSRLRLTLGQYVGLGNTDTGRALVVTGINSLIGALITEGAFVSGVGAVDPSFTPTIGAAQFLANVQDVGSLDQILVKVGLEF